MAARSSAVCVDVSRNNYVKSVESETINTPSRRRKGCFGCFGWIRFPKRKARSSTSDARTLSKQEEQPENCQSEACISTDNVETVDQQEDGQYQKCVPTPNIDTGAKLEDSHIQACISTPSVDTGAILEDHHIQACISTPSVGTGATLEDCHIQACISTPNIDTPAKQEDKPGDCKLEVTPEYLQNIHKCIKKQENWNRRLRKQMMELTGERVEAEEANRPTKPDVQSLICYKRSLERENRAFTKQIKKLKNACISTPSLQTGAILEDHHIQACISTPSVDTGAIVEDCHIQACISTPNVETGAILEDHHIQACISAPNVDTGAILEDHHIQACISIPNVDTGGILEDHHIQACISTPNVDTPAKQEDKPGDSKLEVTPEYLQNINKCIKKQENWNRRLRKQMMELTGERVEAEEAKRPTKPDVQSLICYKRSLERENRAFTKQIKKLKSACTSMPSTGKQAEPVAEPEDSRVILCNNQ